MKDGARAEGVDPAGRGAAPWLPPVIAVLVVQAAFIVAVLTIARTHVPPPNLLPLDSLALPGEATAIGVRIHQEGVVLSSPDFSGIPVTLEPVDPSNPAVPAQPPSIAGRTDATGAVLFSVKAPGVQGVQIYEARVAEAFHVEPQTVQVFLSTVPPERALVFVAIPEAIEKDLEAEPADGRTPLQAAAVVADLTRYASLVYVADPAWRSAPALHRRIEGWGLPRAPVLGTRSTADTFRETIKGLDLSRWKGPVWAVVGEGRHAQDFAFHGARCVLRAREPTPEVDERRIFHAPSWLEAKKRILENLTR